MKVKELIQRLVELDESWECEIIMSSDEEGNTYHELVSIEPHPCGVCIYPGGVELDW